MPSLPPEAIVALAIGIPALLLEICSLWLQHARSSYVYEQQRQNQLQYQERRYIFLRPTMVCEITTSIARQMLKVSFLDGSLSPFLSVFLRTPDRPLENR